MGEELEESIADAISRGRIIILSECINNNTFLSKSKVLLITDIGVFLYKKGSRTIIGKIYWEDLETIEARDNTITFYSDSTLFYKPNRFKKSLRSIIFSIRRCLSDEEINRVRKIGVVIGPHIHSPVFSFSRAFIFAIKSNRSLLQRSLGIIESTILKRKCILDLREFSDLEKNKATLLNIIPFCSDVHTIEMKQTKNFDPFIFAAKIIERKTKIRNFIFHEINAKSNVNTFIKALENASKPKVKGIFFYQSVLENSQVDLLHDVCIKQDIISLGFNQTKFCDRKSSFPLDFFPPKDFASLTVLQLDNYKNIDIKSLFGSIPSIGVLSLANCDLELGLLFNELSSAPVLRLNSLNVSGNKFKFKPEATKVLSSLTKIIASGVEWSIDCAKWIFTSYVCKAKTNVELDLSSMTIPVKEWKQLMEFFKEEKAPRLCGFDWSNNNVEKALFTFLSTSECLETLIMDYCFHYQAFVPSRLFAHFVKCSKTLLKVSAKGKGEKTFGEITPLVIKSFLPTQLRDIDISGIKCGDEGLTDLIEVVSTVKSLKRLGIDEIDVTDEKLLLEFADVVCSSSVAVELPISDLRKISNHTKREIINKFAFASMRRERELYQRKDGKLFSLYMSKQELEKLKEKTKLYIIPKEETDYYSYSFEEESCNSLMNVSVESENRVLASPRKDRIDLPRNWLNESIFQSSSFNSKQDASTPRNGTKTTSGSSSLTNRTKTMMTPMSSTIDLMEKSATPTPLKSPHSAISNRNPTGEFDFSGAESLLRSSKRIERSSSNKHGRTPRKEYTHDSMVWDKSEFAFTLDRLNEEVSRVYPRKGSKK